MTDSKKIKYHTKSIKFGSETLTLFSIDGTTWSSRRSELTLIKERQENQRITLGDIKGEDSEEAKPEKESDSDEPVEVIADEGAEEKEGKSKKKVLVEDVDDDDALAEDLDILIDVDDDEIDDAPAEVVSSKKIKSKLDIEEDDIPALAVVPQASKKPKKPQALIRVEKQKEKQQKAKPVKKAEKPKAAAKTKNKSKKKAA